MRPRACVICKAFPRRRRTTPLGDRGRVTLPPGPPPAGQYICRLCQDRYRDRDLRIPGTGIRRARQRQPIDCVEVFNRDEWRCGLCGGRINSELKHPHPLSASVDHVVPISRGGADIYSNVQAAHLICNLHKGAGDESLTVQVGAVF